LKLSYYSHRHADKLLHSCGLLTELHEHLSNLHIPIFPGKSDAKDRMAHRQVILQPVLNTLIELKLIAAGWLAQPQVKAKLDATRTRYYADFYKETRCPHTEPFTGEEAAQLKVLIEVQFANNARVDSDFKKFSIGFTQGRCDVGVLVVPLKEMANHISSNVANFEYAKDSLQELGPLMAPVPILLIGLSEEDAQVVDLSATQFSHVKQLTGRGSKTNRVGAAFALLQGILLSDIGPGMSVPTYDVELLQAGESEEEPEAAVDDSQD
jgi:hypothetical protein